jgi:two-component system sensor histidine kinase VicK
LTSYSNDQKQRTEVLYGVQNIFAKISQFSLGSKKINVCGNDKSVLLAFEIQDYKNLLNTLKEKDIKIKYLTNITKDNLSTCKKLLEFVDEMRHLDGISTNFSVSESEYLATSSLIKMQQPQPIDQLIYSNVYEFVEQQKFVFESLWNKSTPAEQRIKELEDFYNVGRTEIIYNPTFSKEMLIDLVKKSKNEVLLLLPTINAFLREYRIGVFNYLKDAAQNRKLNVKILTPTNDEIFTIIQKIKHNNLKNFIIYPFEVASQIKINTITILTVDEKESLVIEKTDDSKENFEDAIGLSIYSSSKPTVMSYVSIFESLINQIDLYEQLKIHGKMQEEFINIASHELRTPVQAIIAYCDLLEYHPEKKGEMIDALKRNATALQRLAEDILVVTKIESKTLVLHKEKFNLNELLIEIIEDYKNNMHHQKDNKDIKLSLKYSDIDKKTCIIDADYQRILQVISNLLDNAFKFTKELKDNGEIYITIEERKQEAGQRYIIINIHDNGKGIDPNIIPRLFTKFATKSNKGTGLGLYICKSIIEAHGGKIWAENNKEGNGAIFSFSLPFEN